MVSMLVKLSEEVDDDIECTEKRLFEGIKVDSKDDMFFHHVTVSDCLSNFKQFHSWKSEQTCSITFAHLHGEFTNNRPPKICHRDCNINKNELQLYEHNYYKQSHHSKHHDDPTTIAATFSVQIPTTKFRNEVENQLDDAIP